MTEEQMPAGKEKQKGLREPFSGLSHLVGALLSCGALAALLVLSRGHVLAVVACTVYCLSLILLYSSSAVYHSAQVSPKWEFRLKQMDYVAIFLLIAGTYAPVCLLMLGGVLRWELLGGVYTLAFLGIGMVLFWKNHPDWLRVALYVGMGWLALIALPELRLSLTASEMALIVAGGVTYTLGTVVYATGRPKLWPGRFGSHDLWHVFVLAGSGLHMAAVFFMVVHL